MECSLFALIACFTWSSFYVDAGLAYQDAGIYVVHEGYSTATLAHDGLVETSSIHRRVVQNFVDNPYGRIALGYELSFHAASIRVEAMHISSLATNEDRGVNSIAINARWYPFKR